MILGFVKREAVRLIVRRWRDRKHLKLAKVVATEIKPIISATVPRLVEPIVAKMLQPVISELQHNSGTTLKDAVRRIENTGKLTGERVLDLQHTTTESFRAVNERLDASNERLDFTIARLGRVETECPILNRSIDRVKASQQKDE